MATIPFQNFVFTDPVAAQQATQMAQIIQAAQAEKDRNFTSFANEITRSGTARNNASQQRALTESQMGQQSSEAEKNRKARAAETSQVLASQEKVAGLRGAAKNALDLEAEKFDTLASLIDTEDPPTDSEFQALAAGLSPERIKPLKIALDQKRRSLVALAGEAQDLADYWNKIFTGLKPEDKNALTDARSRFSKDRRAGDLLKSDPATYKLFPKYKGPRLDSPPATNTAITPIGALKERLGGNGLPARSSLIGVQPMPAPGYVPSPTDFQVPVNEPGGPLMQPQMAVPNFEYLSTDAPPRTRIPGAYLPY